MGTSLRQAIGIMMFGVAIVLLAVRVAGGTPPAHILISMVYTWRKTNCLVQELIGTIGKMTGDL